MKINSDTLPFKIRGGQFYAVIENLSVFGQAIEVCFPSDIGAENRKQVHSLFDTIFTHFAYISNQVICGLREYYETRGVDFERVKSSFAKPSIVILEASDLPTHWSFIVGFSESDIGHHAVFDGVELLDVWAGG